MQIILHKLLNYDDGACLNATPFCAFQAQRSLRTKFSGIEQIFSEMVETDAKQHLIQDEFVYFQILFFFKSSKLSTTNFQISFTQFYSFVAKTAILSGQSQSQNLGIVVWDWLGFSAMLHPLQYLSVVNKRGFDKGHSYLNEGISIILMYYFIDVIIIIITGQTLTMEKKGT